MDHTSWDHDTTDGQSPLSVDDILFEFNQERIPEQFKELPGFEKLDLSARPEKEEPSSPDSGPEADAVSAGNASQADIDGWLKGVPAPSPETESGGAGFPAEDEPEPPAPRRRREEKRSRFSFFGRKKEPQPPAEEDDAETSETEEGGEVAYSPRYTDSRTAVHGGSIGRMEQEARSYIAQMQAESGVPSRKERESAASYTYDLDDLLGIRAEPAEESSAPLTPDAGARNDDGREAPAGDLDSNAQNAPFDPSGYEADPTQYADEKPQPAFRARREADEVIDSRFNLTGRRQQEKLSYAGNDVDLSADENYVHVQPTEYNPSQWTPDYDDPLADRPEPEEPEHKKHRFTFGRRKAAKIK